MPHDKTDETTASAPADIPVDDFISSMPQGMGSLNERMGIQLVEISAERVVATMPVEGNTQPYGLLHGGSATSGPVTGVATAVHLGRSAATYEVVISDESGRRLCTSRITCALIPREKFTG